MNYVATVKWESGSQPFTTKTYDRTHQIEFNSGTQVSGSAAPEFAGNAKLVNPEELFVASINSCLMLTFLYWASMKNLNIASYEAKATGKLGKNAAGKMAMTEVVIQPTVTFETGVTTPDHAILVELFKKAHEHCFISNSVNTDVKVEV